MGAPLTGTPFVQVARLVGLGRCLAGVSAGLGFAGDGRGDPACAGACCGTAGALSRATSDRRSHEDVLEVRLGDASGDSFVEMSDCLRPNSREEEDLRRIGSKAS